MMSNIDSKAIFVSFTSSLNKILSNKVVGGRNVWSRLLNVSSPGITQWIQGKTIPSSLKLKSLVNHLIDFNLEKAGLKDVFKDFIEILDKKLDDKFSAKFNNQRTIGNYILQDELRELQGQARGMSFLVFRQYTLTLKRLMHEVYDFMEDAESNEYIIARLSTISLKSDKNVSKEKVKINSTHVVNANPVYSVKSGHSRFQFTDVFSRKKIYSMPNFEIPLETFSVLGSVGERLIDSRKMNRMNSLGRILFPMDRHLNYDRTIETEIDLYKKLLEYIDKPDIDFNIKFRLLETLQKGMQNRTINELYPGLLFSLSQSLFYNEVMEETPSISNVDKILEKFLDIYIVGFDNSIFKPIDITDDFYKRMVELSCSYNKMDFLKSFSEKAIFKDNSTENRKYLHEFKDLAISIYHGDCNKKNFKTWKFDEIFVDIDMKFLHLRHSLLCNFSESHKIAESIHEFLTEDNRKEESMDYIGLDRLNYYQDISYAMDKRIDIKTILPSLQRVTTMNDNKWTEHNLSNLQKQSERIR